MKINTIKIKNFRGIPDMEISLERISFFTGPCGAGKTSVLKPPIIIIGFSVLNQQFVNIYFSNPIYMALFAVFLFVPFIGSFLNHGTIRKIKKGA